MKINELAEKSVIDVEAHLGADRLSFATTVISAKNKGIIIHPIKYEGNLVNFKNEELRIRVIYDSNIHDSIVWNDCKIKTISNKNEDYHIITCNNESEVFDRRKYTRVNLLLPARVKLGKSRESIPAKIYDISETGFSFILDKEIDDFIDVPVNARYEDHETGVAFNLLGKIVRFERIDEEIFMFGCKLNSPVNALMKFIIYKMGQEKNNY